MKETPPSLSFISISQASQGKKSKDRQSHKNHGKLIFKKQICIRLIDLLTFSLYNASLVQ